MKNLLNKKTLLTSFLVCFCFINALSAKADNYKSFDENVVRAYKMAKISTINTNLTFQPGTSKDDINAKVNGYLQANYFKTNKKLKSGLFLLNTKIAPDNSIVIKKIYTLKNPERFMFALNDKLPKGELTDRKQLASTISDDVSINAILLAKIDKKNTPFLLKACNASYNGMLEAFIIVPKIGFGSLINPAFDWLKTNNASDIYNHVSSEIEKIGTGEKEELPVLYSEKNSI